MRHLNIMVTGAGGAASNGFINSLKNDNSKNDYFVIGLDCNTYHLAMSKADLLYNIPKVTEEHYLDCINHFINKYDIDFLHAQPDVEVEFISEHRDDIKTKTFLPSKEAVQTCSNKWLSYKKWKAADIKVPETIFINNEKQLEDAFKKIDGDVWIRNIKGAGGKGSFPTNDINKAKAWLTFFDGYGSFTAAERLTNRTVTWSSIWYHGKLIAAQTRERLYWEYNHNTFSSVSGITGTGIIVRDELIDNIAINSIYAVDDTPHGIFSVDLTYDNNDVPNPTEINIGRFFTTHEFFTVGGLNLPDIYVHLGATNIEPDYQLINPISPGYTWTRGMDVPPLFSHIDTFRQFEKEKTDLLEEIRNAK